MARKTHSQSRVDLIATGRTQGAAQGVTARPLAADVDKWLALGWERVEAPEPEPEAVTDGGEA